jgi:hypothetical protein
MYDRSEWDAALDYCADMEWDEQSARNAGAQYGAVYDVWEHLGNDEERTVATIAAAETMFGAEWDADQMVKVSKAAIGVYDDWEEAGRDIAKEHYTEAYDDGYLEGRMEKIARDYYQNRPVATIEADHKDSDGRLHLYHRV